MVEVGRMGWRQGGSDTGREGEQDGGMVRGSEE